MHIIPVDPYTEMVFEANIRLILQCNIVMSSTHVSQMILIQISSLIVKLCMTCHVVHVSNLL